MEGEQEQDIEKGILEAKGRFNMIHARGGSR